MSPQGFLDSNRAAEAGQREQDAKLRAMPRGEYDLEDRADAAQKVRSVPWYRSLFRRHGAD